MKKMLLITNPVSGKGIVKNKLLDIISFYTENGYAVTVYTTKSSAETTEYARLWSDGYDIIVVTGGDGTLSTVVSGLMKKENRPPIGYIPLGTANDFATGHKIPKKMKESIPFVLKGTPQYTDVGSFNDKNFIYVAAVGLFSDVSYTTPQSLKNVFGHAAYVISGGKELLNSESFRMKIRFDGKEEKGEFICGMVSNSDTIGGFQGICSNFVATDDGLFEVNLLRTPKTPSDYTRILSALTNKSFEKADVLNFHAKKIEFICDRPIPWSLDGEYGGNPDHVVIENHNKAIRIIK